jgi:hypothetical protein
MQVQMVVKVQHHMVEVAAVVVQVILAVQVVVVKVV